MFADDGLFAADTIEQARLGAMQPGESGLSWWENLLKYGATRAIDSHYANQEYERLTMANTIGYQGANGYTYQPGVFPPALGGISTTTLAIGGIALLAVVLLARRG